MGIFNIFKKKSEVIKYPLDPELIKQNKIISAQAQEINSLKGQLSFLSAKERESREEQTDKGDEYELQGRLKEEELEIKKNKYGKTFSFKKFFYILSKNYKIRDKLEIVDKDDAEVFGKFGDFLILEKHGFAITDSHGNVLSYGRNINHVIYKPSTIENQIKRGRICIPYDKDYNFKIDIEDEEIPDILYDTNEKVFKEATEKKGKVKELLIKREKENNELREYIEVIERENMGLKAKLDDTERTLDIKEHSEQTYQTHLSQATDKVKQLTSSIGEMQNQISSLSEMKAFNETMIGKLEGINERLLAKMEEAGDKTLYKKVVEDVKEFVDWAKMTIPKNFTQVLPQEVKETPPVIPNAKLN